MLRVGHKRRRGRRHKGTFDTRSEGRRRRSWNKERVRILLIKTGNYTDEIACELLAEFPRSNLGWQIGFASADSAEHPGRHSKPTKGYDERFWSGRSAIQMAASMERWSENSSAEALRGRGIQVKRELTEIAPSSVVTSLSVGARCNETCLERYEARVM